MNESKTESSITRLIFTLHIDKQSYHLNFAKLSAAFCGLVAELGLVKI
jgi:hypothetical protein